MSAVAEFPAPLQCLFRPKRTKVLWGGRGAGRSWGVARALLIIGAQRPIRVLCVRELQNSIAESVHKVLSDQISGLGLDNVYDIQVGKITTRPGVFPDGKETIFTFEGIKNNTSKIKSYEGIDYCWVEEANKVSRPSWGVLIPTIRKEGSEIWITFNPELETDYTYQRFVLKPAGTVVESRDGFVETTESFVVKMTYKDNPWFPAVLKIELEDLRSRDFDSYLNIWEGHCLQMLEGVVYAKELRAAQSENRICSVRWDRDTPVETFWDLGRADNTAIWFAQRVGMQFRVLQYYEESGEDIHHFLQFCQSQPYTYGAFHLPHDARAKRLGTKRSIEEIVRASGKTVRIVPKLSIADGINAARVIFPNCWFDERLCELGLTRLRHYRYRVVDGQYSNEPLHDEASDGADAFRYMALGLRGPRKGRDILSRLGMRENPFAESSPQQSWMA